MPLQPHAPARGQRFETALDIALGQHGPGTDALTGICKGKQRPRYLNSITPWFCLQQRAFAVLQYLPMTDKCAMKFRSHECAELKRSHV
jgi:hypothetical protein